MTVRLQLIFRTENGGRKTISMDAPKEDLTDIDVMDAMNTIIDRNIFDSNGGDLVGIMGAKLVSTEVHEFDVA